ncbi:MAG: type VI secretion system baseplate subunit TssE [Lamprobacter sp.]|uniref:type VI secretion system baseplate subunit TssE n=1 Tax=Lamprobacter sp. TaxID=3100796 RepID=UPI002B261562|nr:type VI secretion system baseplate subunit TssE [Lamprobacter sp.]MEA3640535.1 type VI secretion system baseplate subunit TssE [Lamprobacter sp.]
MPELSLQERLQPSLLDRLADDNPGERTEPPSNRFLSVQQLRRFVQRDIGWLFNAADLQTMVEGYTEVERSVLNFGIPDLAGFTVSSLDVGALENAIRTALERYEPRLIRQSIRLRAEVDQDSMSHNTLILHIACELWATPVPVEMVLRTALDFESGKVSVTEVVGRSSL